MKDNRVILLLNGSFGQEFAYKISDLFSLVVHALEVLLESE
jgi:hypothetical protein